MKALPIAIAVILGGIALAPIAYSVKNPTGLDNISQKQNVSLNENSSSIQVLSYGLGYALAQQVPPEADNASLIAGYNDARAGKVSQVTHEQLAKATESYQKELMEQHRPETPEKTDVTADNALNAVSTEEAKAFFAENAKKQGVQSTASGLQYKIITEGTGKLPTAESTVTVHYTGKLLNGQEFDSSKKHGQAVTFPLNAVIKGWTEGLALMKEGTKAELYIPAELAYGAQERPGIPANSPLIFEVELLKVE